MMREKSQLHLFLNPWIACLFVLGLASIAIGQDENHAFQSFTKSISPSQLNQILGSHNAVQEKIVSDKIAEMVMKKFQKLSPQQKQRLAELSKEFGGSSNTYDFANKREALERLIRNDPELRRAAEDIRSSFREQDFDFDATDRRAIENNIRQQVENKLQQEIQRRSQQFQNDSATPFDFGNNNFSSDPTQSTNPNVNNPNTNSPKTNSFQNPFENGNSQNNGTQQNKFSPLTNDPNQRFNNSSSESSSNNSSSPYEIDQQNSPHGGFSDDGQASSNEANSSSPGQNSASGQDESLPKESIGHRFNRLVMNSFEKAMEKKVGGDGEGGPQAFERLMNKFVDSVTKSNPEVASGFNSNSNRWFNSVSKSLRNANRQTKLSMPKWSGFGGRSGGGGPSFGGGGFSMPAVDIRSVATFLVIAGMIIAAIVFALRKTALGEMLGVRAGPPKDTPPPAVPDSFQDYEEIVVLIDKFTLWLFGKKASWWNSKIVGDEVAQKSPQYSKEFKAVMQIYDKARYAEASEPVSSQMVQEIRTTLNQLKEAAMAESNQSPNQSLNLQSA